MTTPRMNARPQTAELLQKQQPDLPNLDWHHAEMHIPWQSADSLSRSIIDECQAERARMLAVYEHQAALNASSRRSASVWG